MFLKTITCEVPAAFDQLVHGLLLESPDELVCISDSTRGVCERSMEGHYHRRWPWGLSADQALKSDSVDVAIIDCRNYHLFQPLLVPGCDRFTLRRRSRGSPALYIEPSEEYPSATGNSSRCRSGIQTRFSMSHLRFVYQAICAHLCCSMYGTGDRQSDRMV